MWFGVLIILIVALSGNRVLLGVTESEGLGDIITRYFDTEKNTNIPIFELSYGPEKMSFSSPFYASFEGNFATELQYGFMRFDKELSKNGLLYFSSERAFFGNSSSRFKLSDISEHTIKTEMYRYGGLYNNGFGYGELNGPKILFSHSSSIFWTESDIENFSSRESDNHLLNKFEEENNFGMSYSSGIIYSLGASSTSIELRYQHNVIWTDFYFGDWVGSWLIENLVQRTPDLFNDYFLNQLGIYYPIVYQLYKTLVSYVIYEERSKGSYFPFGKNETLTQRSLRLGIKFSL